MIKYYSLQIAVGNGKQWGFETVPLNITGLVYTAHSRLVIQRVDPNILARNRFLLFGPWGGPIV